ncbi:aminotransferase class I/II-fold pyridoxal phosphate-dependent enzyme [Thermoproteota archaeon]
MPIKPNPIWKDISVRESHLKSILKEMELNGRKILALTGGDPPRWGHINQPISKYLIEAAEEGWHTYRGQSNDKGLGSTPTLHNQLQNAIMEHEKQWHSVEFKPENIFFAGGCAGSILMVHSALLEYGDEVITFEPSHYMDNPTSYFNLFKTKVVSCQQVEEMGWEPDINELRKKITNKTKLIVINNPNNPTGKIYDEKTLKNIVNIAGEYDLPIMSDEIYTYITYDGIIAKSTAAVANDVPVIVINGLAKFFMRTGWKVGYAAIHDPNGKADELIKAIRNVWRIYGGPMRSMPTPMLYTAIKTFRGPVDAGREFVQKLQTHRDYVMKRIDEINELNAVKPEGTYYTFPKIDKIGVGKTWNSDIDFLVELVKEQSLTFLPGSEFGKSGHGHIRVINLPNIDILEDAFNRLDAFFKTK